MRRYVTQCCYDLSGLNYSLSNTIILQLANVDVMNIYDFLNPIMLYFVIR